MADFVRETFFGAAESDLDNVGEQQIEVALAHAGEGFGWPAEDEPVQDADEFGRGEGGAMQPPQACSQCDEQHDSADRQKTKTEPETVLVQKEIAALLRSRPAWMGDRAFGQGCSVVEAHSERGLKSPRLSWVVSHASASGPVFASRPIT